MWLGPEEVGLHRGLCRGVYVGGCVEGRLDPEVAAEQYGHAHNRDADPWQGWICVYEPGDLIEELLAHEYAHLLVPNLDHPARWAAIARILGWSEARAPEPPARAVSTRQPSTPA